MTKRNLRNYLWWQVFLLIVLVAPVVVQPAMATSNSSTYRGGVSPQHADNGLAAGAAHSLADKGRKNSRVVSKQPAAVAKKNSDTRSARSDAQDRAGKGPRTAAKKVGKFGKNESASSLSHKKTLVRSTSVKVDTAAPKSRKGGPKKGRSNRSKRIISENDVSTGPLHLNVKSAYLVNVSNGDVYYEQNPDKPIAPASITKVLTLFLIREAIAQGRVTDDTPIPVSSSAVQTGGSRMSLKKGEAVPLGELIKGISVVSANNACVAVAEYLGHGDTSRFVSQMNAKAHRLGMNNSVFQNPNGLPAPGQLTTARDIAMLSAAYLHTFPESLTIHSMTTHTFHGATHHNANSLLRSYAGADGLKTGFVCSSGYNITATAKRGNTRLVAVVLGAQNSVIRQVETSRLLDYGFRRASEESLGTAGSSVHRQHS